MLRAKQRSRKSETALNLIYKVKADFIIILSFIQSCIKLLLKLIAIEYHFEINTIKTNTPFIVLYNFFFLIQHNFFILV